MELRDGDQRDVAQLQLAGKLDDSRRLARQRDDDEEVILRQGLEYGVELLAGRDVVEEDVVVEEQALELLQDVGLHVARSIGKDAVGLVHEAARAVKIALEDLLPRLEVEVTEVLEHIRAVARCLLLLHLEDGLELAEAVEAELLRKAHDGRARDAAGLRKLVDGDVARHFPVLQDVFPDDHVGIIE